MLMAASNFSIFVENAFGLHCICPLNQTKTSIPFIFYLIWSYLTIIPRILHYHPLSYWALLRITTYLKLFIPFDMRIYFDLCVTCHTMRPRYDTQGAFCCLLKSFSIFPCLSLYIIQFDSFLTDIYTMKIILWSWILTEQIRLSDLPSNTTRQFFWQIFAP